MYTWYEFPEINRKVGLQSGTASIGGAALGCHAGTISGVKLTFGTGYYSGGDGKNILVLDTTKEKQFEYKRDRYNESWLPPSDEIEKILKFLRVPDFLSNNMGDVYKGVVEQCKGLPLWVMSDVINYSAPARAPVLPDLGGERHISFNIGSTADFAKYLIKNKIGYVLQSPIVQNPAHRMASNYSLNQAWFWIHPNHLQRAIDTAEVYGDDQFPTKAAWTELVAKDFNIPPEEVAAKVFSAGVFPEDKRFRMTRTKKMGVHKAVQKALDSEKTPESILAAPREHPMVKEA